MEDQRPGYNQNPFQENRESASVGLKYLAEDLTSRIEQLERKVSQLQAQHQSQRRSPNLGLRIFLYSAGILMVFMALLLLFQSFNLLTNLTRLAVWALVLLAIGLGILVGMRTR
jgi:small-conductance mechanosensitive channel